MNQAKALWPVAEEREEYYAFHSHVGQPDLRCKIGWAVSAAGSAFSGILTLVGLGGVQHVALIDLSITMADSNVEAYREQY